MEGTSKKPPLVDLVERLANLIGADEKSKGELAAFREVHLRSLSYLARANRYSNTPTALGEFLGTTKGTVSQSVKVLEAREMVVKYADPQDRRVTRLQLSKKGRRFVQQFLAKEKPEGLLASALSPKEQDALGQLLLKALIAIQRSSGGLSFGVCASCKFFRERALGNKHQCGLTEEPLTPTESSFICREHQFAG